MCVKVGHFADPDELPGLAHFVEHSSVSVDTVGPALCPLFLCLFPVQMAVLFLGTKKYPIESEYKQFLKDHGGRSNASTATHTTCFQFDVASDHLEAAMDRFAQFFIAPLFTESATERELNAVHSEFFSKTQKDPRRLYQFDKSLSSPNHPFSKFSTGNLQTLRLDVDPAIDVWLSLSLRPCLAMTFGAAIRCGLNC